MNQDEGFAAPGRAFDDLMAGFEAKGHLGLGFIQGLDLPLKVRLAVPLSQRQGDLRFRPQDEHQFFESLPTQALESKGQGLRHTVKEFLS
jgi:hypothetical protein